MKKLVIEHLKKTFDQKVVLEDIDYTFTEGKIYGLLGRNGSGKTTLFNCLNEDLNIDDANIPFGRMKPNILYLSIWVMSFLFRWFLIF